MKSLIGLILLCTCAAYAQPDTSNIDCRTLFFSTLPVDSGLGAAYVNLEQVGWVDIPIALHIIHYTNGTGGVDEEDAPTMLAILNNAYAGAKMRFFIQSIGHINNSYFADWSSLSHEGWDDLSSANVSNTLNLYVCPEGNGGVSSFAPPLDSENERSTQSVIIGGNSYLSPVVPHEVGHYFNLFHTFMDDIYDPTCADESNADDTGDLITDDYAEDARAPEYNFNSACVYVGDPDQSGPCGELSYDVDGLESVNVHNFMSYARGPAFGGAMWDCRNTFTPQQLARARTQYETRRPELQRRWVTFTNKVAGADAGGSFTIDGTQTVASSAAYGFSDANSHTAKTNNERFSTNKHKDWNGVVTDFTLSKTLTPPESMTRDDEDANFTTMNSTILKARLLENGAEGGQIGMKDPWYLHSDGTQSNSVFYSFTSPYSVTGAYNQQSGGTFLNQGGNPPNLTPPYYSVHAPETQTISDFTGIFRSWDTSGAVLTTPTNFTGGYYETPVIFKSWGTRSVTANYKAHLGSNISSVLANNGQHRMVQLSNATEFVLAYCSMGELWSSVKLGTGSFSNEVRVSSGTGGNELPSLTNVGGYDGNYYVVWRRSNGGGSWRSSPVTIASVSGFVPVPLVTVKNNGGASDVYVVYQSGAFTFQTWSTTDNGENWTHCGSSSGAPVSLSPLSNPEADNTTMTTAYGAADGTIALRDYTSSWSSPVTVEGSGSIGYWDVGAFELSLSFAQDPRVLRYGDRTFVAWDQEEEYVNEGPPYSADVSHKVYQERDQYGQWSTATVFLAFDDFTWEHDPSPPRLSVLSGENIVLEWPYFGELLRAVRTSGEWSVTSVGSGSDPELSVSGGVKPSSIIEAHPAAVSGLYRISTSSSFSSRVTPGTTVSESLPLEYSRLLSIRDTSTGATYTVHVSQPRIGSKLLSFVPVNDTLPNITEGNFWSFLNTIPVTATNSTDTIAFDVVTTARNWGKTSEELGLDVSVTRDLTAGELQTKLAGESKKLSVRVPVGTLAGTEIALRLAGVLPERESALVCQLAHVYRIMQKEAPIELLKSVKKNDHEAGPTTFGLGQNYPNPFNPETTIPFSLENASHVRIAVYDLLGRETADLVNGTLSAGSHTVQWDATSQPSGTYICRMTATDESGKSVTRSMRMQYVR